MMPGRYGSGRAGVAEGLPAAGRTLLPAHAPVKHHAEVDVDQVASPAVQQEVVQVTVSQAQQVAHLRGKGRGGNVGAVVTASLRRQMAAVVSS